MTERLHLHRIHAAEADLAPEVEAALVQLAIARSYAMDLGSGPWEFAVEIERLTDVGLTASDLRWLVQKGYVSHGREVTQPGDRSRQFQCTHNLAFSRETCFILTESGASLVGGERGKLPVAPPVAANKTRTSPSVVRLPADGLMLPAWDPQRRTLSVDGRIVKQYRVPSRNQEAVLSAFQEEGWPPCIDDPLPPSGDQHPKHRLHATIRCLNANQENRLIRFRGNGTGQGVLWEPIIEASPHSVPGRQGLRRAA